jgi:hypothetical protein
MATPDKTKPESKEVRDFHTNSDVDGSSKALHHTLGPNANQAAAGNHTHDGGNSAQLDRPLISVAITGSRATDAWRTSVIAALVALGATDGTTP